MATSGTTAYNPAAANLVLNAFGRIGIRRTEITAEHMADADNECNLTQVDISLRNPNFWKRELYSATLTASTATYTLPARMMAIQAAYITKNDGSTTTDTIIWPLSGAEYAALPNKDQKSTPTSYFYNRLLTPTITLWPVPDNAATYTLKVAIFSQIEDSSLSGGTTLDMPYRFLDVFVAKLAHRLARIYKPELEDKRKMDAEEAWTVAAREDQEDVPIMIAVAAEGYWRS